MRIVNIREVKTQFFRIIETVTQGNEILIAIEGKPVAKLTPISKKPWIKFGVLKGKIKIFESFNK